MKSDIQIARETKLLKIDKIATQLGIDPERLFHYGLYIAKAPIDLINENKIKQSNLILVTAITPTKAGVGKTTVSIGLAQGLNKIGKKSVVALREPSLGPVFGMKGGAAGGGYSQVLPMENINLHFTGDFHAITAAHNTISALLDNYIYRNRFTEKSVKDVLWKRVMDVNDRSLRHIIVGLRGSANGIPAETGFDITAASELMAVLCLAENLDDLERRINNILLGYLVNGDEFTVKDLGVGGAIATLLKDALDPNLVQTTENTAAFVHGGPFANIAHGCNSVLATKMGLSFGDYVITEAGFGADLGAEKFFNIKCRKSGLIPQISVLVVSAQSLKMHGGTPVAEIKNEDLSGLKEGFKNLEIHIKNLKAFGPPVLVAFNRFPSDTEKEIEATKAFCESINVPFAINDSFVHGGDGSIDFAKSVVEIIAEKKTDKLNFTYKDDDSIETKIEKVAKGIYGAADVVYETKAKKELAKIKGTSAEKYPICMAKTQYSFSGNPLAYGVPKNFELRIRDIVVNKGAEFVIPIVGEMMRMPGLPAVPAANGIHIENGQIEGLS